MTTTPLIPTNGHTTWQALEAALEEHPNVPCRTKPDLWFPPRHNSPVAPQINACRRHCPALVPCLEYALAAPEDDGVWGGTTAEQRRRLRLRAAA